ncbi:MAG: phage tail protein [Deltaproteobacteria bacterium]|nr:phage tail protein [Deltaproteobacteria bacterium]
MKHPHRNIVLLAGIAVMASSVALALGPADRSYSAASTFLSVDGVGAGLVRRVEGGRISADVIHEQSTKGVAVKKHIGIPRYEDVSVEFGFGMSRAFNDWVMSSWKSNPTRKDVEIVVLDNSMQPVSAQKYAQAYVAETTIPACDAASKDPAYLTVKLGPQFTRSVTPTAGLKIGGIGKGEQKVWLPANFSLSIDGLDCGKVSRIESFTVKTKVVSDAIGDARDVQKTPTRVEFPNLSITISEASAKTWLAWHDDFVVKGNNDDTREKNGSLVFLDPTGKKELGRVNLFNLGIFAVTRNSAKDADGIATVTIELYCEKMELGLGSRPAS